MAAALVPAYLALAAGTLVVGTALYGPVWWL